MYYSRHARNIKHRSNPPLVYRSKNTQPPVKFNNKLNECTRPKINKFKPDHIKKHITTYAFKINPKQPETIKVSIWGSKKVDVTVNTSEKNIILDKYTKLSLDVRNADKIELVFYDTTHKKDEPFLL